ncbi:Beta-lactamase precursor [Aquisphaera giovannonii]|uniref:Beta-lactamase n=1 Tax=Aquisphaera giovannonii TaxID=406548 RepID=A0A5B9VVI6_9BACT|nr:MBL fold metallo-hydrolase [Aquisphaera giovannonii]QEH32252.1 Beta-lactamase precursor [Aquisphaera giovannonii]
MNRRRFVSASIGAAGALAIAGRVRGDGPPDDSDPTSLIPTMMAATAKMPIESRPLADGLHLVYGPGGNIAVLDGPDGLTIVDAGLPNRAADTFEVVKRAGGKPVVRLINTHWHFDHAGGNEAFGRAGAAILATPATRRRLSTEQYTEIFKMKSPASPPAALPVVTLDEAEVHVGPETLRIKSVPPAHTDGDLFVHFTKHDVIHTGDLFSNGFYPNIDASSLGWIGGMVAAADVLLKLAGPSTRIIPGHGPVATRDDLARYRTMLATVHDRLAKLHDAGKTLREAIDARPTADLDAEWADGFFTGGMFTRVAYDGLVKHRAGAGKAS